VHLYGPTDTQRRGGSLSMNFFDPQGRAIDHRVIEQQANQRNISLRTGCFCNPGAGELALGISRMELAVCFAKPTHQQRLSMDDFRTCIDGKSTGAVRVSVGLATNFEDVHCFLAFAKGFLE